MKKIAIAYVVCLVAISALWADVSESQLREIFDRAGRYIDDPEGPSGEICYAIRQAGGDTNRVVSLMKQIIAEGADDSTTRFYLSEIAKYGTTNDVSFLYDYVSDTNVCRSAADAVLRIEGVSSHSVSRICALLPRGNPQSLDIIGSWMLLAREVQQQTSDAGVKSMAISNIVEYASFQNHSPERIDRSIRRLDPTYERSKRRLGVLRAVQNLGVNEWQTNFVTTAIRELEAYPEANLPE